ncbi:MAG: hypothetical protein AAF585_04310 [Verrucomicrobiota bacterium]
MISAKTILMVALRTRRTSVRLFWNTLANYGEEDDGIYTRFRRGPIEVWMIDDCWFSQTTPSWADPDKPTCLGRQQWEWLQRTLKESTAQFKLLCGGMVWYPKGNWEKITGKPTPSNVKRYSHSSAKKGSPESC